MFPPGDRLYHGHDCNGCRHDAHTFVQSPDRQVSESARESMSVTRYTEELRLLHGTPSILKLRHQVSHSRIERFEQTREKEMQSCMLRLLLTRYDFYNFGTHSATPACDCNFCSRCVAAPDRSLWVTGRWTIKCRVGLRRKSLQRHRRTAETVISAKLRFGSFGASATHCACLAGTLWPQ